MNGDWKIIEKHLTSTLGKTVCFKKIERVSGGCINDSYKITDESNKYWFIKTNQNIKIDMFATEFEGLRSIKNTNCIQVPNPVCYGQTGIHSYLILEYIDLLPNINQKMTGHALAQLHLFKNNSPQKDPIKKFGWIRDNTIGTTPQSNKAHANWVSFFKDERLLYQLNLAKNKGYPDSDYTSGLKLAENLEHFFDNYSPHASLLHGDLWSGNCASDGDENPIIFDPAVYIGDRETDIAMTELFGGFNQNFYDAYNEIYALDQGYKTRKKLYNLYHILNHFNLFGGSYALQAAETTRSLLAEL